MKKPVLISSVSLSRLLLLALLLPIMFQIVGCDMSHHGLIPTPMRGGTGWNSGLASRPDLPEKETDTVFYMTGISYPADYDWQKDTAYGKVDERLCVYRNGKLTAEYATGEKTGISAYPDMHRILKGHLYTDYPLDNETIVMKDGEEIFRYKGRELMRGFLLRENEVHTLGADRKGRGFSYRVNGVEIFSNTEGYLVGETGDSTFPSGALYLDNDRICFAYYITAPSSGKKVWYLFTDNAPEQVILPSDMEEVHDIRMIEGSVYMAGVLKSSAGNPVVFENGVCHKMDSKKKRTLRNCRLMRNGADVYLRGEESIDGKPYSSFAFGLNGKRLSVKSGTEVSCYCFDGINFAYIATENSSGKAFFQKNGTVYDYIEKAYYNPSCLKMSGNRLYAAITPYDTTVSPYLWKNGTKIPVHLHGYITSLSIETGKDVIVGSKVP